MKTLCLALGLLLLTVCYCNAAPYGVGLSTPHECCFTFSTTRIPRDKIIDIEKTQHVCREKAFIIYTAAGMRICYGQSVEWVKTRFEQLQANRS